MKKWTYLVIGLGLIVNAIIGIKIGIDVGPSVEGVRLIAVQGLLFGVIGIILFYKSIKLFAKREVK